MIYVDNAATTQLDSDAYEAMKPYLIYDYGNASSAYSFARNPKKALKKARSIIASSINTNSENIFLHRGGQKAITGRLRESPLRSVKKVSILLHHKLSITLF